MILGKTTGGPVEQKEIVQNQTALVALRFLFSLFNVASVAFVSFYAYITLWG